MNTYENLTAEVFAFTSTPEADLRLRCTAIGTYSYVVANNHFNDEYLYYKLNNEYVFNELNHTRPIEHTNCGKGGGTSIVGGGYYMRV